jgi:hypothetical protein
MIKRILFLFSLILSLQSFGQKLIYSGNGNILDSNNTKLSPKQVEILLNDNEDLFRSYVAGRSKQTVGNIMLYSGLAMVATDVIIGASKDSEYPTFFTIVGGITTLIGIPVKMGFSKKIKNVINDYNAKNGFTYIDKTDPKLEVITNNYGLGMRFSFN